jgi:hypothetical protein
MTTSIRQEGQFSHIGLTLGAVQNVSSHTTVLGGTHITTRFTHGIMDMCLEDGILLQRELLQALSTHGYRPDVSGAACDLGDAS